MDKINDVKESSMNKCTFCEASNSSCPIEHEAISRAVKAAHEHTTKYVNQLVCDRKIYTEKYGYYYAMEFQNQYEIILNKFILQINNEKKDKIINSGYGALIK